jgi:hypothetical protein
MSYQRRMVASLTETGSLRDCHTLRALPCSRRCTSCTPAHCHLVGGGFLTSRSSIQVAPCGDSPDGICGDAGVLASTCVGVGVGEMLSHGLSRQDNPSTPAPEGTTLFNSCSVSLIPAFTLARTLCLVGNLSLAAGRHAQYRTLKHTCTCACRRPGWPSNDCTQHGAPLPVCS